MLKRLVARAIESRGYELVRADPTVYSADGLRTVHNHDFLRDPAFARAYARGVAAAREDYDWQWRVHIGLWAAASAARLDGDFVECGVNRGFLSSAIMELLDWDTLGKVFWLLDTFAGVDETILPPAEQHHVQRRPKRAGSDYVEGIDSVVSNFAAWKNVRIIVGSVPSTLEQIEAETVAYLHLDMNSSTPEVAALDALWPRLTPGAVVLLDDWGYEGFEPQHEAMSAFARDHRLPIASLPTGQGLLLKA
jgi:hypothetical protein